MPFYLSCLFPLVMHCYTCSTVLNGLYCDTYMLSIAWVMYEMYWCLPFPWIGKESGHAWWCDFDGSDIKLVPCSAALINPGWSPCVSFITGNLHHELHFSLLWDCIWLAMLEVNVIRCVALWLVKTNILAANVPLVYPNIGNEYSGLF